MEVDDMWLSVAFPRCPHCGDNANQCYHKDCPKGGKLPMEINSDNAYVRCPSCEREWPIKQSDYYCSCGYVFSADDVSDELNAIIINAKLIANDLKRKIETKNRIERITDTVIANTASDVIKSSFGERVWNLLKSAIPAIVQAVKGWLGI